MTTELMAGPGATHRHSAPDPATNAAHGSTSAPAVAAGDQVPVATIEQLKDMQFDRDLVAYSCIGLLSVLVEHDCISSEALAVLAREKLARYRTLTAILAARLP